MSTTNKQSARQEGDTPRTDEIAARMWLKNGPATDEDLHAMTKLCRTLERELSAKQAELESLKAAQGWIPEIVQKSAPAMKALRERLGKMTHDERQSLLESALELATATPPVERSENKG